MSSHPFRPLTRFERDLLSRLLDVAEGEDGDQGLLRELREQAATSRARTAEHGDYCRCVEFELPFKPPFDNLRMVAEALANDEDGQPIDALLFLANGRLHEVEIVRVDGLPLRKMPAAGDFEDYAHYAARHGISRAES